MAAAWENDLRCVKDGQRGGDEIVNITSALHCIGSVSSADMIIDSDLHLTY